MKYFITGWLLFVSVLYGYGNALAQSPGTDSAVFNASVYNAVQVYHRFLTPEKGLYNGRQYVAYASTIKEGDPYFHTAGFTEGSIVYDGVLYEHVPMLYDLVTDVIVIKDAYRQYWLQLLSEKIASYDLSGHSFVRITEDSANNRMLPVGFYELLYNGTATVLKKQIKSVQEEIKPDGVKKFIVENISFYLKKNNNYYSINTKNTLLRTLKDRKTDIKKFIRKNKLKLSSNREKDLVSIVSYYDKLTSL